MVTQDAINAAKGGLEVASDVLNFGKDAAEVASKVSRAACIGSALLLWDKKLQGPCSKVGAEHLLLRALLPPRVGT